MNKNGTNTGHEACPLDAIVNPPCNEVFLMDCMEGMKQYPDKFFDIAIVDPPYGIGMNGGNVGYKGNNNLAHKEWDKEIPNDEYFCELRRVSKQQIIWGGNYYDLSGTRGFVIWDKGDSFKNRTYAECEFVWTSFDRNAKIYKYDPIANGDYKGKIHPTQKPVKLYDWLIMNYAEDCETILDTHVGSGSSRIAAHKAGKSFIGFEIDKDYHEAQEKRFKEFKKQLTLF